MNVTWLTFQTLLKKHVHKLNLKGVTSMKAIQRIKNQQGAIGWILLWALGIPIPLLIILFLIRGGT